MTEQCDACGEETDKPHSLTNATVCCNCFKHHFDFVDVCVHDACADGDHELEWDGRVPVCSNCGVSAQTLTDYSGHKQWLVGDVK